MFLHCYTSQSACFLHCCFHSIIFLCTFPYCTFSCSTFSCCNSSYCAFSYCNFIYCTHIPKYSHRSISSHIASLLSQSHFIPPAKGRKNTAESTLTDGTPAAVLGIFRYKNNTPSECATTIGLYSRKVTFYGITTKSNHCLHRAPYMQLDFCYLILYTIYSHYYILLSHLQSK